MPRYCLFVVFVGLCLPRALGAAEPVRVGTFDVDASPPVGSPLAYDPTKGVETPLSCRGIVLMRRRQADRALRSSTGSESATTGKPSSARRWPRPRARSRAGSPSTPSTSTTRRGAISPPIECSANTASSRRASIPPSRGT